MRLQTAKVKLVLASICGFVTIKHMQLQTNLWIEGAYYLDFDQHGQLRIVGPNNHLHFATVGLYKDSLAIDEVHSEGGELVVKGHILASKTFLHDPIVAHIMKVRRYIDVQDKAKPDFQTVLRKNRADLLPNYIGVRYIKGAYQIEYKRLYQRHWYGTIITFAPDVKVDRQDRRRGFSLKASNSEHIRFTIKTESDQKPASALDRVISGHRIHTEVFKSSSNQVNALLDRTAMEITHLVRSNKTSGFDYGTVFPRDWMESADLGKGDFDIEAIRYMYHKALEFVDPQGAGWHENIVGEFEFEKQQETLELSAGLDALLDQSSRLGIALKDLIKQVEDMYVIRNMVDIEPRYVMGLDDLPHHMWNKIDLGRIKRAAHYVVAQAESAELITFKKIPPLLRRHKHDEYYGAGNWRDSMRGYKMVHPVIAPYDVNVVFYPRALEVIENHADMLGFNVSHIKELRRKWQKVKDWYRFTNTDGSEAYALALYDVKPNGDSLEFKKLEVNHLDEAYDLFYGHPSEAEVVSFAQRLLDPDYFYTKSGPIVVGAKEKGYDTTNYHGKVIWTKQTAFAVAGLYRQLIRAQQQEWPRSTQQLLKRAVKNTARTSIEAWLKLGGIPELHYDDKGMPRYYDEQEAAEGPMNAVQLWSAVGARRIIKTYIDVCIHEESKPTKPPKPVPTAKPKPPKTRQR
jgi:hypothetical protein